MTDLSRGARARRGGRRPGWLLLTALLVLAIGASSALVFTNRAELLKLAVILALWAAVVAAFVSVIYRRQSDVDQARARDLKLVYDLQLDREISARREYELTVESQLRRELASELRAQADDEVSALRAELAALRTNLEILFDAELSDRPALETERKTGRGHSDWDREIEGARERVNRVASVRPEESARRTDDSSIIDVHEEPLVPTPPRQPAAEPHHPAYTYQPADAYTPPRPRRAAEAARQAPEADRGGHWRPSDREAQVGRDDAMPPEGWTPPAAPPVPAAPAANAAERQPESRSWAQPDRPPQTGGWAAPEGSPATGPEQFEPQPVPVRRSHRRPEPPTQPEPPFVPPPPPPEPAPQQQRPGWSPPPEEPRRQEQPVWQPVSSEGQWVPAGAPGSHWNSGLGENSGAASWAYDNAPSRDKPSHRSPSADEPPSTSTPQVELRGRHSSASAEAAPIPTGEPVADWSEPGRRARSRHSTEYSDPGIDESASPAPAMSPPPPPTPLPSPSPPDRAPVMSPPPPPSARHRSTDPVSEIDDPPSGVQSVAELLARLQTTPPEGGRRRRRED